MRNEKSRADYDSVINAVEEFYDAAERTQHYFGPGPMWGTLLVHRGDAAEPETGSGSPHDELTV